jgi:hypothetical protein
MTDYDIDKTERAIKARLRKDVGGGEGFERKWALLKLLCLVPNPHDTAGGYEDLVVDYQKVVEWEQLPGVEGASPPNPPESLGNQLVEPSPVELTDYEEEHTRALSAYYGLAAAAQPEVKRMRGSMFAEGLLTADQAAELLTSPAAALLRYETFEEWEIPLMGHVAELTDEVWREEGGRRIYTATVFVEFPDDKSVEKASLKFPVWVEHRIRKPQLIPLEYINRAGEIDRIMVRVGSVLDRVRRVSETLAERYRWDNAEAVRFVLTGEQPIVLPIRGKPGIRSVVLEIAPYVSAKTVAQLYLQLQRRTGYNPQHTSKGARVLRFVLDVIRVEGKKPAWSVLTQRWNDSHPEERYLSDRAGLQSEYNRAFEQIVKPRGTTDDFKHLRGIVPGVSKGRGGG